MSTKGPKLGKGSPDAGEAMDHHEEAESPTASCASPNFADDVELKADMPRKGVQVLPVERIESIFTSGDEMNTNKQWIWQHPDWPQFQWDMGALVAPLGRARQTQGRLNMAKDLLSPALAREALAEILKVEGISTSAIEGKHLNPASVAASVARHLGLPEQKSTPRSRDAEGLVSLLIDACEGYKDPMTMERLCSWQKALFPEGRSDLQSITVGHIRPSEVSVESGVIGRETVHFKAVPRASLEENLSSFLDWFNRSNGDLDGLIRAGVAHLWFVTIHPFEDGNGRITRAITDMAISQDENSSENLFRMSSRILKVKEDYYTALESAQNLQTGLVITPWLDWFLHQVESACIESEFIIKNTLCKAKFWAMHHEDNINPRQRKALNRLLDAGPEGFEGGLTNRKYANLTKTSPTTAFRDLDELVSLGCLLQGGAGGRSTSYDIPWGILF